MNAIAVEDVYAVADGVSPIEQVVKVLAELNCMHAEQPQVT